MGVDETTKAEREITEMNDAKDDVKATLADYHTGASDAYDVWGIAGVVVVECNRRDETLLRDTKRHLDRCGYDVSYGVRSEYKLKIEIL
jgi:hypothetical protein